MAGAIALAGCAALRTGSGLVRVVTPSDVQLLVSSFSPCLMVVPAATCDGGFAEQAVEWILEHCQWADVVALGPGMGRTETGQEIVRKLYQQLAQPVVVDADGLNNLADAGCDLSEHQGMRILTPHPGEFSTFDWASRNRSRSTRRTGGSVGGSSSTDIGSQGTSNAGHRWPAAVPQSDGQFRNGHGRLGGCVDGDRGLSAGTRVISAQRSSDRFVTCTVWRVILQRNG